MRYTVTTFKVRLEVAESGIRLKDSKDAEMINNERNVYLEGEEI